MLHIQQGKSEGFDSCDLPSNLTQTRFKSLIFQAVWPWNLMDDLKQIDHLFYATLNFVHDFKSISEFKLELQSRIRVKIGDYFVTCDKMIGHLFYTTSSFVYYFKYIGEFKLELQSGKTQFGPKSTIFYSRVTFKLDIWPWKTNGLLFYDNLSFVHHFNAIGKFKLKLQSGNSQFVSKSTIFSAVWP